MEAMKQKALDYLSKGLIVIPLKGRYGSSYDDAKRPLVRWEKWQDKLPTPEIVSNWFLQKPNMDIGILTGPKTGIFVIDVDGPVGLETLSKMNLPATPVNVTPNGLQYFFKWDDRLNGVSTNLVKPFPDLPGIDTRGSGGYCVVAPSVNLGDKLYKWQEDSSLQDFAPIPEDIIKRLLDRSSKEVKEFASAPSSTPDNWLVKIKEGVAEGENRHKAMTQLASFYMSRGIPEDDVIALMTLWNQRCSPPKEEREFLKKLDSFLDVWRSGKYRSNYKEEEAVGVKFKAQSSSDFIASGDTEIKWLVKDLIPAESIGFLHGYGGQGKSWVTLDLAIEIGKGGGQWLDHFKTGEGKVLYIDEESATGLLRYRYNKLLNGKGLQSSKVDVSFLSLQGLKVDNEASLDAFRGLLLEMKPTIVIVDPFVSIHGMNENSVQDMAKLRGTFKAVVKDCQTGLLFIDHESKPGEYTQTAAQRQRGSSEKDALGDYKMAISNNVKLSNPKGFQAIIEHSKARWGVSVDPFTVSCRDTSDATGANFLYEGQAELKDVQ